MFIPVFFFGSEYAQISLGKSASQAGIILLYFFIGFVIAAQIGGRMLDRGGAKRPVVIGCVLGAVGFWLWAGSVTDLSFSAQQWYIILAGAGMGFMLGPASTDAVNRASTALLRRGHRHHPDGQELRRQPGPRHPRHRSWSPDMRHQVTYVADRPGRAQRAGAAPRPRSCPRPGAAAAASASIPHFIRLDFAHATQTVLYIMAAVMAVAAVVAFVGLRAGRAGGACGRIGHRGRAGRRGECRHADAGSRGLGAVPEPVSGPRLVLS